MPVLPLLCHFRLYRVNGMPYVLYRVNGMTFRYNKAEPDLMCLCCSADGASGGLGAGKVPVYACLQDMK